MGRNINVSELQKILHSYSRPLWKYADAFEIPMIFVRVKIVVMKKGIFSLIATAILLLALSCTGVKKDCNGVKHYKHKNGFYIWRNELKI